MKKIALLLVMLIAGCQSLGLAPATTMDQKIVYAYAGVTAVLQSITAGVQGGQLSAENATKANNMALQVKSLLDVARAAEATNPSQAQKDLNLASAALAAVQQYLNSYGVK